MVVQSAVYFQKVGNASAFTVSCTDDHEESGHNGIPYSDQDTVYLMLSGQCNDGVDNDGDGLTDEDDPGCHTDGDPNDGDDTYDPLSDDEDDTSPSMTLQACDDDGVCADTGETLIIELDEVEVIWTSQNTDFCDSVGTFNMTGSPTVVPMMCHEPDAGETVDFIVACGNGGVPQVARSVAVRLPAIRLIPCESTNCTVNRYAGWGSSDSRTTIRGLYTCTVYPHR
ncbi:MAG: hypothetical protein R3B69_02810 [Candidatus Paceibacterota bacterium]